MALVSERIKKASKGSGSRLRSLFESSDSEDETEAEITKKEQQQQQTQATWTAENPLPDIQTQEEQCMIPGNSDQKNTEDRSSRTPKRFPDVVEIVDSPHSSMASSVTHTLRTSERKQKMIEHTHDLQPLKRQLMPKETTAPTPRVSLSPSNAKPRANRTSNVSALESLAAPPAPIGSVPRKRAPDAIEGSASIMTMTTKESSIDMSSSVDMVDLGSTGPPRKKIKQRKDAIGVESINRDKGINGEVETVPCTTAVENHLSETEQKQGNRNAARAKKNVQDDVTVGSKTRAKRSKRKSAAALEAENYESSAPLSPVQKKKSRESKRSSVRGAKATNVADAQTLETETSSTKQGTNDSAAKRKKLNENRQNESSLTKTTAVDDENVSIGNGPSTTRMDKGTKSTDKGKSEESAVITDSCAGDSNTVNTTVSKCIAVKKAEKDLPKAKAKTKEETKDSPPSSVVKPKKKRTFQDQVLAEMLFSCKAYNLKTLAQALNTTDQALQHLMLSLLDKKIVVKKEFASKSGKVKELYWANQDSTAKEVMKIIPDSSEMEMAMKELATLQRQETEYAKEMTILTQELSNAEIESQLTEMEASVKAAKEKLVAIHTRIRAFKEQQQSSRSSSSSANKKFQKTKSAAQLAKERCPRRTKIRINAMRGEWKSRKEKCMDFVDQIADGMEKKPKEIIKLLEIETDEMEGLTMPPKHVID